jgi:hypothetical protein
MDNHMAVARLIAGGGAVKVGEVAIVIDTMPILKFSVTTFPLSR